MDAEANAPKKAGPDAGVTSVLAESNVNVLLPAKPNAVPRHEVFTYESLLDGRSLAARRQQAEDDAVDDGDEDYPAARSRAAKKHPCVDCGKRFATSSNLSRHRKVHLNEAAGVQSACKLCGKIYVSESALSMHMLTHQPRHACGVCGKLFSRLWSVQCHMRSHTQERPYGCAHCGRSFADRNNLRSHMRSHAHVRRVATCDRCNRTFSLQAYLIKHQTSCEPEDDDEDEDEDDLYEVPARPRPSRSPSPPLKSSSGRRRRHRKRPEVITLL